MFFALDTLGTDTLHIIRTLPAREKWDFVHRLAHEAGFSALHLTQTLYERTLSMPLAAMPQPAAPLRLLLSLDRPYTILSGQDAEALGRTLGDALRLSHALGVTDVYLPPPDLPDGMQPLRGFIRETLQEVLSAWIPKYRWEGVQLSLESRVTGSPFQGLLDYAHFVQQTDRLGALIHAAELFYDGYSENELLEMIQTLRVHGIRIGDADPGLSREGGIGLPVGEGTMGLRRLLAPFASMHIAGILTIHAPFEQIGYSLEKLQGYALQQG